MSEKEVLASIGKAVASLKSLNGSLRVLALTQLVGEFYTRAQRKDLYAAYGKLRTEDTTLYANLQAAHAAVKDAGIGYEERVKKYGEAEAEKQIAPIVDALDARREHNGVLSAFQREHEIIYELIRAKESVGNWE